MLNSENTPLVLIETLCIFQVVRSMLRILNKYNETTVESLRNATDPRADPRCHGFAYVPWMDEEYAADCPNYLIDDNI